MNHQRAATEVAPQMIVKPARQKNQSEWRGDGTAGARRHKITRKDKEAVSSIMCSTDAVLFVP